MKVAELIEIYTAAIEDAAEQGADSVPLSELQRVHAEIGRIAAESPDNVEVGEAALEHYKAQLAANAEHRRSVHEFNLEMLRATVMTGQSALKSSLLINGGAAVALLASSATLGLPTFLAQSCCKLLMGFRCLSGACSPRQRQLEPPTCRRRASATSLASSATRSASGVAGSLLF